MFIKDLQCISHQQTYDQKFFQEPLIKICDFQYSATEPSYQELIPAGVLRRMSKIIRMGVGTGMPLLQRHREISGIIIGTAHGGVDDSMKFLGQIEQYDEGTLTPTNFVQSTPNSLAGVLSMMSGCDGYNNTHVHEGLAFENALIDAFMFLEENPCTILVGAADEISAWNLNIDRLKGFYKSYAIHPDSLLRSETPGTISGEGATMFVISSSPEDALAKITDVSHISTDETDDARNMIQELLTRNQISNKEVDVCITGMNGDVRTDHFYSEICGRLFPDSGICFFKHLTGEYPTATAFAVWFATHLLNDHKIPSDFIYRGFDKKPKNILIYNHYFGTQHGAILLSGLQ